MGKLTLQEGLSQAGIGFNMNLSAATQTAGALPDAAYAILKANKVPAFKSTALDTFTYSINGESDQTLTIEPKSTNDWVLLKTVGDYDVYYWAEATNGAITAAQIAAVPKGSKPSSDFSGSQSIRFTGYSKNNTYLIQGKDLKTLLSKPFVYSEWYKQPVKIGIAIALTIGLTMAGIALYQKFAK